MTYLHVPISLELLFTFMIPVVGAPAKTPCPKIVPRNDVEKLQIESTTGKQDGCWSYVEGPGGTKQLVFTSNVSPDKNYATPDAPHSLTVGVPKDFLRLHGNPIGKDDIAGKWLIDRARLVAAASEHPYLADEERFRLEIVQVTPGKYRIVSAPCVWQGDGACGAGPVEDFTKISIVRTGPGHYAVFDDGDVMPPVEQQWVVLGDTVHNSYTFTSPVNGEKEKSFLAGRRESK